ncbi:MAG: hypothetical protein HC771_17805 [Synechococcales cyanobacterium CRU_2_2]|nr:hypothetical protein [Synechococcales cyanobacterium CRU_2_2]
MIADMKRVLEKTVPFPVVAFGEGRIDADLDLSFVPGDPNVAIAGEATFRGVTAKVPQLPLPVKNAQGKLTIQDKDIRVLNATGTYGALEIETQGQVHLETGLNLTAKLKPLDVNRALETAAVKLPVAVAGIATAENLRVTGMADSPIVTGKVRAQGPAGRVLTVDQVPFKEASSLFEFKDSVIGLSEIRAVPNSGGLVSGSGAIDLNPGGGISIKTTATELDGDALSKLYTEGGLPIKLGQITAQTQTSGPVDRPKTTVRFQAPAADYPARGVAQIADGIVTVDEVLLRVAEGTVRGVGKLQGDRWSGTVNLFDVRLNQFSPDLRGKLQGNLALGGPVQGFSAKTLEAQGTVVFNQGIALVEDPLKAQIRWDGGRSQLLVTNATAPGLQASGSIQTNATDPNLSGSPAITALKLNVTARGYDLKALPLDSGEAPVALNLRGFADFDGTVAGAPEAIQAQGKLRISQFQLNDLPFDSFLTGNVTYTPQGVNLNLAGDRDAIALNLDPDFMPRDLLFKQNGQTLAQVDRTAPDQYSAQLTKFNLAALNIRPNTGLGDVPLEGLASGSAQLKLTPLTASGNLTITNPALGKLKGTALTGQFSLANGLARLTDTVLTQDLCRRQRGDRCAEPVQTRYTVEKGELVLGKDPKFDLAIAVQNGDTQGLLRMVQWFEFGDIAQGLQGSIYGSAADLDLTGLGLPERSLFTQLQRFSEITQLVAQQTALQRQAARYPALSALNGQFSGRIEAQGSLQGKLKSSFNISGQDWAWGRYDIDSVSVQGEFADGLLTLLPIRVTDGTAVVAFSGQLGGQQQSGQLRADRVPVSLARNFIDLPVDLAGELDLQATVAGSADNPQAIGSINLTNGKLNGTAVETKQAGFNYVNARLGFGGSLGITPKTASPTAANPQQPQTSQTSASTNLDPAQAPAKLEPVRISGSIPYVLPFSKVQPDNERLALNLDVKNDGLAFLDLLSQNQIQWRGGEGQIQLKVGGTLADPVADGKAIFRDASLAAQVLPGELLTNVNGEIQFDRDRIRVQGLEGLFSKGLVVAKGSIPISRSLPNSPPEEPLNVGFRELKLDLRGLYRGGADGNVIVSGTALRPELAGKIMLKKAKFCSQNPAAPRPKPPSRRRRQHSHRQWLHSHPDTDLRQSQPHLG